jgi:heat shock protein HspQ
VAADHKNGRFWDTPWNHTDTPLTQEECDLLTREYDVLRDSNIWFRQRRGILRGSTYYLCTDASEKGYGIVLLDPNMEPVREFHDGISLGLSSGFPSSVCPLHIYYKELFGTVQGVLEAVSYLVQTDSAFQLWVLGDNTASVGSLRNGYSSTDVGNDMIDRLHKKMCPLLKPCNLMPDEVISYHTIATDANVADVPSRILPDGSRISRPSLMGKNAQKKERRKEEKSKGIQEDFDRRLVNTQRRIQELIQGRTTQRGEKFRHRLPEEDLDQFTQFMHDQDLFLQQKESHTGSRSDNEIKAVYNR